jgi:hypothetical protein
VVGEGWCRDAIISKGCALGDAQVIFPPPSGHGCSATHNTFATRAIVLPFFEYKPDVTFRTASIYMACINGRPVLRGVDLVASLVQPNLS